MSSHSFGVGNIASSELMLVWVLVSTGADAGVLVITGVDVGVLVII